MGRPITVLVLAVGGNVSQGILKSLRHDSRPLRIVGADIAPLQMGLFTVDQAYVSPWAHEDHFLPWLIETCKQENVDVILSGAEPVIVVLARCQAEIFDKTGAVCVCSPLPVLELCDDKLETCRWLETAGLPHPAYADGADEAAVQELVSKVGYPLIAKPRRGGGARGVLLVEDGDDLAYALRKPDYLIQESVGTDATEYTVGCFREQNGTLAESCCMRRDLVAGTTFRAELGAYPAIRAVAEAIVKALKPLGPCNVQLRMTARGPVCFEINARFSGTTPIRSHFGYLEVSAALDHFLEGTPVKLPRLTEGMALRYWNELYPDPNAVNKLVEGGTWSAADGLRSQVETYGME